MIAVSFVPLFLLIVFILSLRGMSRSGPSEGMGTAVRRFFQYAVQFVLVAVVGAGLTLLLGRLLQRDVLVASDGDQLAQGLAFTLVGVPCLWLMVRWSARRIAAEPRETSSVQWSWYLSLGELVPLTVFLMSLPDVLLWVVRAGPYDAGAIARSVVWGAAWAIHRRVTRATTALGVLRDHELAGAALGLLTAAVGLASFIASSMHAAISTSETVLLSDTHPTVRAAVSLAAGASAWYVYWIRSVHRSQRTLHWHVYVMVAGVAAGLVTAIASFSTALYDVLVWFVGTPNSAIATTHFSGSIDAMGAFITGALVWWYHRRVLAEAGATTRDEAQRVYEYMVSLIALIAASIGAMVLLVALLESFTASALLAGDGAGNTLLAATTLLSVGGPLWWWFWREIGRAVSADAKVESASPIRRVYLFLLFGGVGVAALIALLVTVYQLLADIVAGNLGESTLRSMRWGIGVLVTSAAVASYHWRVYRAERSTEPKVERRSVLLVGPANEDLVNELRRRLAVRVDGWTRLESDTAVWTVDAVVAALEDVVAHDVLVIGEAGALRAVPVERG